MNFMSDDDDDDDEEEEEEENEDDHLSDGQMIRCGSDNL